MTTEAQTPNRTNVPHAPLPGAAGPVSKGQAAAADDPRARAAHRAAELRDHLGGMEESTDKFYIDPRSIPDGWSYEWKAFEILGKQNPSYQVSLAHRGWEAVPRSRHPEMMPESDQGETITRDGQILMERPKEITDEVKTMDNRRARDQVRAKEAQLGAAPDGQFERRNKDQSMASVKKNFESIPIPRE